AKWNGSAWSALGSGLNSLVNELAVSGSDLYVGGAFTTAGGSAANRIAKWDWSAWSALGSGLNSSVYALAVSGSDLYVGGDFTTAGDKVSGYVARATPLPEINLTGNGTSIADGDTSPSTADHTDFGSAYTPSGTVVRTFTIQNTGNADLNLTGTPKVQISGANAADFSVTAQPSSPVAASGTTTFTVTFDPSASGTRTATISIANDDGDENPYNFAIQGTGTASEIAVEQPLNTNIADGGSKSFGTVNVGANTSLTFTIKNTGTADLTGLGITIDGPAAAQFTVTASPTAPVSGPSGSTTFTVKFAPASAGAKTAALHLASNDADENPFDINLTGTGREAPTITDIANQTINEDSNTGALAFTIADAETAAASLTLTKSSSNQTLVPDANIVFGGSGASRNVTVTPAANQSGSATVTVTVTDGDGLTAIDTFTLTVNSVNDAPTLNALADVTILEDAPTQTVNLSGIGSGAANETQALVVTASSSNPALIPTPSVSHTSPNASGSLSFTPVANGNGSATITVTVKDDGGTANGGLDAVVRSFTVTVTPVNDTPTISSISDQSINTGGSTGPLAFTVEDIETAAGSLTVSATSSDPSVVPVGNIVFGGSGANRTVTATAASGACGMTTITVTVSDGLASASDSFVVTLIDNQPPIVSCPQLAPVSVDANCSAVIPNVLAGVVASDNCTPTSQLTLTQSTAAGTAVSLGTHTITVTVTDLAGNSTQCQTTFSVVPGVLFSQPVPDIFPQAQFLTCIIGNFQEPTRIQNWKLRLRSSATETVTLTVAATTVNTAETGSIEATVTDQNGLQTVTVVHPATQGDSLGTLSLTLQGGNVYALAIKRTGQAAHYKLGSPDKRLEIGFAYPLLYLEHHRQAWVVNAAPNETVSIDLLRDSPAIGGADPQATTMTYSVRRPDCTVVVPSTTIPVSGTISFPAGASGGAFVIFFESMDGHFAVRMNSGCDGGFYALPCPPKVQIACPANISRPNDPGQCGAIVNFSATATGVCAPAVTYSKAPGSFFPIGTPVVMATATDIFGETATCNFTVTVNDTEKPVVTCPGNITVDAAPGQCSATVTFAATVTDNCPGATVVCSPASGSVFQKGTTTVTCTGTDASGNVSTCSFTVTVNDTEKPVVTCPANITVNAAPGQCNTVVTYTTTVTDNCPGATVVSAPPSGSTFQPGTTTVTSTATDASGNVSTCTFTVTVNDVEPPVIVLNATGGALSGLGPAKTYFTSVPGSSSGGLRHGHGIAYDTDRNTVWVTDNELNNDILEFPATQPDLATVSALTRFHPAGISTIEGIYFDPTDNSLWVVDSNGVIIHLNRSGGVLSGGFSVGGTIPAGTFGARGLGIAIQGNFV
ncbi:MAG: choice-of-anchor D domain-containing protein, partial [Verrucomicrobiota bacterium]